MDEQPGILIVDDQPANLRAMQRLLQEIRGTIFAAENGESALALCMQHRFALALIDVRMPGMSGFELADYLRGAERTRNIPLIFVTAAPSDQLHALQGYQTGAVDFIQKPIDDRILRSKVNVFLELHNAREELRRHRDHLSERVAERTASLEQAHKKLHALNRHLIRIREEERRVIAQAMHDEMGNTLAQQKMTIEWLQLNRFDHERMNQELERLKLQVEDTIAKVRHITLLMRPPILDQCGLPAALEWQTAQFEKTSAIPCQVEIANPEASLDEEQKIALFRILQESLTNIGRHARATAVRVAFFRTRDLVHLVIEDNGQGIADEILTHPTGNLGLRGMEERACQQGGELHLETSAQGTRITTTIPINPSSRSPSHDPHPVGG
ncbi:MAG: response regulator [Magnetococcales bacterium]|nr:response regulator [Magnetococcales bacterium]